jgi:prepilin-type N-terminal cleavage/methylation domain-containing protein
MDPMGRKAEPVRQRISAAASSRGFTLIESLVALAILGVIVGVLVRVHLQTLRAEEFTRLRGQALQEAETILTGSMLGREPQAILDEARKQGWKVEAVKGSEPGAQTFTEWRVAVSNPSAPVVSLMLRGVSDAGQTNKTTKPAP